MTPEDRIKALLAQVQELQSIIARKDDELAQAAALIGRLQSQVSRSPHHQAPLRPTPHESGQWADLRDDLTKMHERIGVMLSDFPADPNAERKKSTRRARATRTTPRYLNPQKPPRG